MAQIWEKHVHDRLKDLENYLLEKYKKEHPKKEIDYAAYEKEFRQRFSACPEVLWWALHEYAAQHGKSWIGIFPSSYWVEQSTLTRETRDKAVQEAIRISRASKYRERDWQTVYEHTRAEVLCQETADRHYDALAAQIPGAKQVQYNHNGATVLIWEVPVQASNPLTGRLEQRQAEEILVK